MVRYIQVYGPSLRKQINVVEWLTSWETGYFGNLAMSANLNIGGCGNNGVLITFNRRYSVNGNPPFDLLFLLPRFCSCPLSLSSLFLGP